MGAAAAEGGTGDCSTHEPNLSSFDRENERARPALPADLLMRQDVAPASLGKARARARWRHRVLLELRLQVDAFCAGAEMSKHTPGPWKSGGHFSKDTVWSTAVDSVGKVRLHARLTSYYTPDDEIEANVRLIVAAPEMLEALKRALWVISDYVQREGKIDYSAKQAIEDVIAKAEGKE